MTRRMIAFGGPQLVTERERRAAFAATLEGLSARDLQFLCNLFKLKAKGSKIEMAQRLLESSYELDDLLRPVLEIMFSHLVEPFVSGDEIVEVLEGHDLSVSGSKRDMLERLIENRIFSPEGFVEA